MFYSKQNLWSNLKTHFCFFLKVFLNLMDKKAMSHWLWLFDQNIQDTNTGLCLLVKPLKIHENQQPVSESQRSPLPSQKTFTKLTTRKSKQQNTWNMHGLHGIVLSAIEHLPNVSSGKQLNLNSF